MKLNDILFLIFIFVVFFGSIYLIGSIEINPPVPAPPEKNELDYLKSIDEKLETLSERYE